MKRKAQAQPNLGKLISVEDFAASGRIVSRRGHKVSPSYIYRMIRQHEAGEREGLPFSYIMIGEKRHIYIITD